MKHNIKILQENFEVPSLPTIYIEINKAINNPRTSTADIASIISKDTGLTARLLRIANSAFYGFPQKIDSIKRALVCIGTRELHNLVLCTSIVPLFKGISEKIVSMKSFWQHSIGCGLTAKIIATYLNDPNPDRFFVAGLLHDIGKLLICKCIPEKANETLIQCKNNNDLCYEAEKKLLGFDHTDTGHMLLENWNIPTSIEESVSFHHKPDQAKRYPLETAIVHISDITINAMQLGSSGEHFVPPLNEKAWKITGLKPTMLDLIIQQMKRQIKEVLNSIITDSKNG